MIKFSSHNSTALHRLGVHLARRDGVRYQDSFSSYRSGRIDRYSRKHRLSRMLKPEEPLEVLRIIGHRRCRK